MKSLLNKLLILSFIAFSFACSESEDPSPHIVGTWQLQSQADFNVPTDYNWFAAEYSLENLGLTAYHLDLMKDGTFTETIERTNLSDLAYQGTWELDEEAETLTLIYDSEDEAVYDVVQNSLDLLKFSFPVQGRIISNSDRTDLLNTYTTQAELDAYLDTLYDENDNLTEEGLALFPIVSYEQLMSFKRSGE